MNIKQARFDSIVDGHHDFDGGRAFVQASTQCDGCKGYYAVSSCLVFCHPDGSIPVTASERMTRAKGKIVEAVAGTPPPFKNIIEYDEKNSDVKPMCYLCYGEKSTATRSTT